MLYHIKFPCYLQYNYTITYSISATTNSPPSRDTDFKLYPVKRSAPIDQPAKEIERLQREMEGYLQQIQVIEQRVLRGLYTNYHDCQLTRNCTPKTSV